jgi:hypothetical protein
VGPDDRSGRSKWKRAADRWAWPSKIYFQIFKLHLNLQIQKGSLPLFKKYSLFACGYV